MILFTRTRSSIAEPDSAPPLAPIAGPIDREHLSRMTLGERDLEREVLGLFDRQAELLMARMRNGEQSVAAAAAHTLKGSARGIGAWRVASAAEALELASVARPNVFKAALSALSEAVDESRVAIAELLRAN